MSKALKFNSPLQVVALVIVIAFLIVTTITQAIGTAEICRTISTYSQVDYIGDYDDVRIEVHLSR